MRVIRVIRVIRVTIRLDLVNGGFRRKRVIGAIIRVLFMRAITMSGLGQRSSKER